MFDVFNNNFEIIFIVLLPITGLILGYIAGIVQTPSLSKPRSSENTGEILVRQKLEEYCRESDAHVLNCVTLRLEDGSTTQIDHILVSKKGLFVIETKHYKGWIFGKPKSKEWAQIIYDNKYLFQNPLLQNYKHVKAVQRVFEFLEPGLIHSIVVFTGQALSLNRIQFFVGRLEYIRLELTFKTDVEHQAYLMKKFGW